MCDATIAEPAPTRPRRRFRGAAIFICAGLGVAALVAIWFLFVVKPRLAAMKTPASIESVSRFVEPDGGRLVLREFMRADAAALRRSFLDEGLVFDFQIDTTVDDEETRLFILMGRSSMLTIRVGTDGFVRHLFFANTTRERDWGRLDAEHGRVGARLDLDLVDAASPRAYLKLGFGYADRDLVIEHESWSVTDVRQEERR
jgi:hypothetical protein